MCLDITPGILNRYILYKMFQIPFLAMYFIVSRLLLSMMEKLFIALFFNNYLLPRIFFTRLH